MLADDALCRRAAVRRRRGMTATCTRRVKHGIQASLEAKPWALGVKLMNKSPGGEGAAKQLVSFAYIGVHWPPCA